MSGVKIVKFGDASYFECQWSGIKLKERYGIPKKTGGEREGSFADGACAVAYYCDLRTEGKISDKNCREKLNFIHQDLGLHKSKHKLVPAPDIDPVNPDFSYREDAPWMYQKHLHVPIDVDVAANKSKCIARKENKKRQCFFSVPVEGEVVEFCANRGEEIELEVPFEVRKIGLGSQKSKEVIILSSEDSESINKRVNSIADANEKNKIEFHGNALLICRLNKDDSDGLFKSAGEKRKRNSKKTQEEKQAELDELLNSLPTPEPVTKKPKKAAE